MKFLSMTLLGMHTALCVVRRYLALNTSPVLKDLWDVLNNKRDKELTVENIIVLIKRETPKAELNLEV